MESLRASFIIWPHADHSGDIKAQWREQWRECGVIPRLDKQIIDKIKIIDQQCDSVGLMGLVGELQA